MLLQKNTFVIVALTSTSFLNLIEMLIG